MNNWDDYHYPIHMTGFVSTLPEDPQQDVVKEIHKVIAEVTGKPVEQKEEKKIGFY